MAINTEPTNEGYTILQGVNKIIEMLGGSGGVLPEVTDADNGKVLTVVDGSWAAASGGGGGENSPLMIYITSFNRAEDDPDNPRDKYYYYNTNITLDDINAAYTYNTFKPVYVCIPAVIGDEAMAPNYYEYSGSANLVCSWPENAHSHELGNTRTITVYVDENHDVLLQLYEQSFT